MASVSSSPKRSQRFDSPFTKEQEAWLILEYGAVRNITTLKRRFRVHYKLQYKQVPRYEAFKRLVTRFMTSHGQVRPAVSEGRPPISEETVTMVKEYMLPYQQRKEVVSLSTVANSLGLSYTTVWRVVRKRLGWYPYKPRKTVPLTEVHKAARVDFCNWLLSKLRSLQIMSPGAMKSGL